MGAGSGVVDPDGPGRLAAVARQLWAPLLAGGEVRVALDESDPAWRTVETYRAVPDAARARLLVPEHPRLAAAALSAYPGLRPPLVRVGRRIASAVARLGVLPGRDRVHLQVRAGDADPFTPLGLATAAVGRAGGTGAPVGAVVGVRTGANAKATLQLFGPEPLGFAKIAWEEQSADFVRRELAALTEIGGSAGPVRVPRVLGEGMWGGHPYVLTEPLPADVHRPRATEGPRPDELLGLAPVLRDDVPAGTAHLQALAARLRAAQAPAALVAETVALLDTVLADQRPVPVVARWHGDLVPWNAARSADGTFWVWDWETVEPDVVIGLDAVHWALHAPARVPPERLAARLVERMPGVRATLAAMGAPRHAAEVAVAVHALAMVDRGLGLAAARGGWDSVLVGPQALRALVGAAVRVTAQGGRGGEMSDV